MYWEAVLNGKVLAREETSEEIDMWIEANIHFYKGVEREARFDV
jgi:hypothetical protein